jgi:hypothetical protein
MATTSQTPKHDLGSLRISDGQRRGGRKGKAFGLFAAILGGGLLVAGSWFGLTHRKPKVEVIAPRC